MNHYWPPKYFLFFIFLPHWPKIFQARISSFVRLLTQMYYTDTVVSLHQFCCSTCVKQLHIYDRNIGNFYHCYEIFGNINKYDINETDLRSNLALNINKFARHAKGFYCFLRCMFSSICLHLKHPPPPHPHPPVFTQWSPMSRVGHVLLWESIFALADYKAVLSADGASHQVIRFSTCTYIWLCGAIESRFYHMS